MIDTFLGLPAWVWTYQAPPHAPWTREAARKCSREWQRQHPWHKRRWFQ